MSDPFGQPAVPDDDDDDERPAALIPSAPPAPPAPPDDPPAPAPLPPLIPPAPPAASPTPAPPPAATPPPSAPARPSIASSDPLLASIAAAADLPSLVRALEPLKAWQYSPEHDAGITRAKTYVAGSDKDVLAGFFVYSVNEWKLKQERVLVLTPTSYYRVAYDHKTGKIDHYHKSSLDELRVVEKTVGSIKVYTRKQDGNRSVSKWMSSMLKRAKDEKPDEFEHAREYVPIKPVLAGPSLDVVIDTIAAVFAKTAEINSKTSECEPPSVITTDERRQILLDRKEAEKLYKEKVEREAASEELRMAISHATESRVADGLVKPIRRAKKAIEVDPALLDEAHQLKELLEEEKREKERLARLEAERVEREAATEELKAAVESAKESRDSTGLVKPTKRAKKAVDVSAELIAEAEKLKVDLDEEKRERERQEAEARRLEAERVEREAATEALKAAMDAAKESRDASGLAKPIKRAKKAIEVTPSLLDEADKLKADLEEEKRERERLAEVEAARSALVAAIDVAKETRDASGLPKAIKRGRNAGCNALVEEAEGLASEIAAQKAAAAKEKEQAAKTLEGEGGESGKSAE
mmetsp:Transcript_43784/g.106293  ORF Transcript_43784/g.106293 Transcript_43784/m.106293 type:complete len:585 (+) Transcript_43784:115-1869(+)